MGPAQPWPLLDGMGQIQTSSGKAVADRPGVDCRRCASKRTLARARHGIEMLRGLQFAIDKMQPVCQAVKTDRMVVGPEAVPAQSAKGSQRARDTARIEADDHEVSSRPQNTLHLSQATVRIGAEIKRMESHQHIDAFTLDRQFVSVAYEGRRMGAAVAGDESMVDRALRYEIVTREGTDLENVIAERDIKDRLQAIVERTDEILSALPCIQGFQRQGNLARLRARVDIHGVGE